jgi:hypothetical protein
MELYNAFGAKPMLFYPESVTHTSDVQVLDVK